MQRASGFLRLSVPGTGSHTYHWNNGLQGQIANGSFGTPTDSSRFYEVVVLDALGFENRDSLYVEVTPLPIADIGVVSRTAFYTFSFQSASQNATT
ncbi:MAG: hypothetical protein AAGM67_01680, partial [Bacteroidota bacterium]